MDPQDAIGILNTGDENLIAQYGGREALTQLVMQSQQGAVAPTPLAETTPAEPTAFEQAQQMAARMAEQKSQQQSRSDSVRSAAAARIIPPPNPAAITAANAGLPNIAAAANQAAQQAAPAVAPPADPQAALMAAMAPYLGLSGLNEDQTESKKEQPGFGRSPSAGGAGTFRNREKTGINKFASVGKMKMPKGSESNRFGRFSSATSNK